MSANYSSPALLKTVLSVLLQYCGQQGLCDPSLRELSHAAGYSKRSVLRAIHDLVRCQVLIVERRHKADGTQLRNLYRLAEMRRVA